MHRGEGKVLVSTCAGGNTALVSHVRRGKNLVSHVMPTSGVDESIHAQEKRTPVQHSMQYSHIESESKHMHGGSR
jgi:hypothetical protein